MQILNIKAVIVGIPSYQGLLLLSRNMHLNSKGGVIVFLSIYLLYNRVTQYVGARENFVLFVSRRRSVYFCEISPLVWVSSNTGAT